MGKPPYAQYRRSSSSTEPPPEKEVKKRGKPDKKETHRIETLKKDDGFGMKKNISALTRKSDHRENSDNKVQREIHCAR